jgi:hypothetical protein
MAGMRAMVVKFVSMSMRIKLLYCSLQAGKYPVEVEELLGEHRTPGPGGKGGRGGQDFK